jgi:hypothetical protein
VLWWPRGGPGPERDPGPPPPALAGYQITYEVDVDLDPPERSRRMVAARRPFAGRDVAHAEGAVTEETGLVVAGGHLYRLEPQRALDLGPFVPGAPPGDLHVAAQLEALARMGFAEERGAGRVAGRGCRVWRLGQPATDPFRRPTAAEYTDVCFDADGLVLEERWHLDGRRLRSLRALTVSRTAPAGEDLSVGDRPVVPQPLVEVTELPVGQAPRTGSRYWTAPDPPWGFQLRQRLRVAPRPGAPVSPGAGAMHVDVFALGADFVLVEHRERSAARPAEGAAAEPVDAGRLGGGWLWLTPQGPEVRVGAGSGAVVVRGSIDPDRLVVFARRLRAVGGSR